MRSRHVLSIALLAALLGGCAGETEQEAAPADTATAEKEGDLPMVVIATSLGDVTVELFPDEAPVTVDNFLGYVDSEFFDGTIFHRVIPGFMIQGGGFTASMERKPTRAPIVNEADNGLQNDRGTLAMARLPAPNSATAQFFINLVDNENLNHRDQNFGYAVFGRVVEGMEVVDSIARVPRTTVGGMRDVPTEPVVIQSIRRGDAVADGP